MRSHPKVEHIAYFNGDAYRFLASVSWRFINYEFHSSGQPIALVLRKALHHQGRRIKPYRIEPRVDEPFTPPTHFDCEFSALELIHEPQPVPTPLATVPNDI